MTIVYADMCADLFHYGHIRFLAQARSLGGRLIVGIHSDDVIKTYKPAPVMTMWERIEVVAACRYVDQVIAEAPLHPTADYLTQLSVDIVCHGDDLTPESVQFLYGQLKGFCPIKLVPYTKTISTSLIVGRLRRRFGGAEGAEVAEVAEPA
jgi:cytidyltransferase-like protein